MTPEAIKRAHAARINAVNELRALDESAEGREFSAEEAQTESRLHDDISKFDNLISDGLDAVAKGQALSEAVAGLEARSGSKPQAERADQVELRQLRAFVAGEEASAHFGPETRAALQTDNTGGHTVDETMYSQIIKPALERSSAVARNAKVINTAQGEQINMPKRLTIPTAAFVAEGAQYSKSDGTFGTLALNAYKYGFISQVSNELVQDSAFNIEAEVAEMGAEAIATAIGDVFLNGDGTNKPEGALAHDVTGTFAATDAITGDELIDVVHSLTAPYRPGARFIVADSTIAMVRKLKDTDGQYLWQPSMQAGEPDRLLGYPIESEYGMPAAEAGNKSVIFGDLSRGMIVRFARGVEVVRSDEYAYDTDMLSWRWTVRCDSGIVDATAFVVWAQAS